MASWASAFGAADCRVWVRKPTQNPARCALLARPHRAYFATRSCRLGPRSGRVRRRSP